MAGSHQATFRQYPLLNLGGMRSSSNVVVVGHGMVGHRFVEALRSRDTEGTWQVTVLAEESDAAYDRVGLTSYTEHWDRAQLALPGNDYAGDDRVELRLSSRVAEIDRAGRTVVTADGTRVDYDALVLATGSYAFVPPGPGRIRGHAVRWRGSRRGRRGCGRRGSRADRGRAPAARRRTNRWPVPARRSRLGFRPP